MRRALTLTFFVVFLPAIIHAKEPVGTTVCAIAAHPSRFHNKTVRIRAAPLSGMETATLVDVEGGKPNDKCDRINLDFESVEHDDTTNKFRELFGAQIAFPPCDFDKLNERLTHILDSKKPTPKPCSNGICLHCPRYNIVATFTGKLRYSGREPGHARFGHMGIFSLQLDVRSVSNLDVTDTQPVAEP